MSNIKNLKDIFNFDVNKFSFLLDLGFIIDTPQNTLCEANEIEYISNNFTFTLGWNNGRDGNYRKFTNSITKEETIYPEVALKYFLDDYEEELNEIIKSIQELDKNKISTLIEVELYKRHSWIITTADWVNNKNLTNAVRVANQWFYSQPNMTLALENYTHILHSLKRGFRE